MDLPAARTRIYLIGAPATYIAWYYTVSLFYYTTETCICGSSVVDKKSTDIYFKTQISSSPRSFLPSKSHHRLAHTTATFLCHICVRVKENGTRMATGFVVRRQDRKQRHSDVKCISCSLETRERMYPWCWSSQLLPQGHGK